MQWLNTLLVLVFCCLLLFSCVQATKQSAEAPTCDVFLQPSKTLNDHVKSNEIDFSKVLVKLVNSDTGTTLDSMPCSSEGIAMLPIFDTNIQNYEVEIVPPKGWIFDKTKQSISVNGDTEVSFDLQGFTIEGKVYSKSMDGSLNTGPGGINIILEGENLKEKSIEQISSELDGSFQFSNVLPGLYTIKAKHHSYNFERDTVQMKVGAEPLDMTRSIDDSRQLVVGGYSVRGSIYIDHDNNPLSRATIFLKPLQQSTASLSLSCAKPSKHQKALIDDNNVACAVESDDKGEYVFKGIPRGDYQIIPYYKEFNIQPSSINVKVQSESVSIPKSFQIKEFTSSGYVQNHNNDPIDEAQVKLKRGSSTIKYVKTKKDGKFTFEQVEPGTYSIEVSKDQYHFEKSKVKLSPTEVDIRPIHAVAYDVCGSLHMASISKEIPELNHKQSREISIKNENGKIKTVKTDSHGKYCAQLAPGTYNLTPFTSKSESDIGLQFIPDKQSIDVHEPSFIKPFKQKTVYISGQVRTVSEESSVEGIEIVCQHAQNRIHPRTIKTDNKGKFKFEGLLPGSYKITSEHDEWCWETDTPMINAQDNVSDADLSQKGFRMTYIMDHDSVNLSIVPHHNPEGNWTETLMNGKNHICLPKAGKYNISTVSCFRFNKDDFEYDTNHPQVVDFDAISFLVTGFIRVNAQTADKLLKEPRIVVRVKGSPDNSESNSQSTVAEYSHETQDDHDNDRKYRYYRYDYWASLGEQLEFVPESTSLLFYPRSRSITVPSTKECLPPIEEFEGRPGKYIEGKVEPPVSNASVHVFVKNTSHKEQVASTVTDESGRYSAGPLYDDLEYYAEMYKKGFQFERESDNYPFNFQSLEFSTLDVKIVDDSDSKTPVDGVFVSVSGRQSGSQPQLFKFKALSDENGHVELEKLPPGSYTLRMQSKEYRLEPQTQSISVGNKAEQKKIDVKAHRVAYSIYGTIRSLTGEPQEGIVVAAIRSSLFNNDTKKNTFEVETQTNESGIYRLRGLVPGEQYIVTVGSSTSISRSSPEHAVINVSNQDTLDIDFVVFFRKKTFDITGTVNTPLEWFDKVTVELLAGKQVIQRQSLPISRFFEFPGISRDVPQYTVRTSTQLSKRVYDFTTSEQIVEVKSDLDSKHINLEFNARLKSSTEANGTPAFSLIFIMLGIAAFFYRSQLPDLWRRVQTFMGWETTNNNNNKKSKSHSRNKRKRKN